MYIEWSLNKTECMLNINLNVNKKRQTTWDIWVSAVIEFRKLSDELVKLAYAPNSRKAKQL